MSKNKIPWRMAYKGKPVEECTKEELIEALTELHDLYMGAHRNLKTTIELWERTDRSRS